MANPDPAVFAHFLTDLQVALCEFSLLSQGDSQRKSSSRTKATRPRTFKELRTWDNFFTEARDFVQRTLSNQLDLPVPQVNPMLVFRGNADGLAVAASEADVQGALNYVLLPYVNYLARKVGLNFRYNSGGSGRSCSRTDMVIIDDTMAQNMDDLSDRVYGVGEIKGCWQWEISEEPYAQQIFHSNKEKMLVEVLQQVYGDMVFDEAIVGFISNYNQTIFFYRDDATSKALYFSPLVRIDVSPVEKFLYVLKKFEDLKNIKRNLSRNLVEVTPRVGYQLQTPDVVSQTSSGRASKRRTPFLLVKANRKKTKAEASDTNACAQVIYGEQEIDDIPVYDFDAIGVTGGVVGLGKYGNVLAGEFLGAKIALKTFDACERLSLKSFISEQIAYQRLQALQGVCIPRLLFVGRLPHMSMVYLALTNEKGTTSIENALFNTRMAKRCKKSMLDALTEIHGKGVMHGDLRFSNILWNRRKPFFIDFEYSKVNASAQELRREMDELEVLLEQAIND